MRQFVKQNTNRRGHKVLTAGEVTDWVNTRLGTMDHQKYSVSTVNAWMHILGFQISEHKKVMYFDGHERPDVAAGSRRRFFV